VNEFADVAAVTSAAVAAVVAAAVVAAVPVAVINSKTPEDSHSMASLI
jgi:hypothetical protein